MHSDEEHRSALKNRKAMVSLALTIALASLGTSIANIALPILSAAFYAPFDQVRWVVVSYLITLTMSNVIAGWLGDLYGLKRMQLVGLCLFLTASFLCAFSNDLLSLILARAVQGIGAAFMMTLTLALVRASADEKTIGGSMGLIGTMMAVGTALGPSLGGFVMDHYNWRAMFLVLSVGAVLAIYLSIKTLPRDRQRVYHHPPLLLAFDPTGLWYSLLTNLCVMSVMMTVLIIGPFYLGAGLHLSVAVVNAIMTLGPLISMSTGVPSGRLVDRLGSQRVMMLGLFLLTSGAFSMSFLPHYWRLAGYLIAVSLLTPGFQLFQAANNTFVMTSVTVERRGVVSGLLNLSRNSGLIVGTLGMAEVFMLAAQTNDLNQASYEELSQGLQSTFLLAGVMMASAFLLLFWRRSR